LNAGLVAEDGVWIKEPRGPWEVTKPLSSSWKTQICPILEMYARRLAGSFVEEKDYALVWHYRAADAELSSARAKELTDDLVQFTANIGIEILQGSKAIEVRNADVNKGMGALHWINKGMAEFILAVGDDGTDEDLFRALPDGAYSIKVGLAQSQARLLVREPAQILTLLDQLAERFD
jgi:trehalose 6-phosphate synthase/phosphatase